MISIIIAILGILLTIIIVIGTHEFAHFITARYLGVKVLRFSIGFGKTLFSWYDKKHTEYVIALIPLGGYVKMLDENEGPVPQDDLSFAYNKQPFYKKFLIVLAGNKDQLTIKVKNTNHQTQVYTLHLENWSMDKLTPEPIHSLGIHPYTPTIRLLIHSIQNNSPAARSTLQINDKLIALNKKKIVDWTELTKTIEAQPNKTIHFTIERQGKTLDIPVTIGYKRVSLFYKVGYLGITPKIDWPKHFFHTIQYSPSRALVAAWHEVINFTYFNYILIGKLLVGKISLQSLGGPITIFETAGEALNSGILSFISFLAFINVSIGILNLLPIPGLDGSHLLLQIIEAIIRKPLPEKFLVIFYRFGFVLILFIMIQAFINDILRL